MTQLELLEMIKSKIENAETRDRIQADIATLQAADPDVANRQAPMTNEIDRMHRRFIYRFKPATFDRTEDAEEVSKAIFDAYRDSRVIAPFSWLAGSVCKDGNIFNPYIHRNHMPFTVIRTLGQAYDVGLSTEAIADRYNMLIAAHLMNRDYYTIYRMENNIDMCITPKASLNRDFAGLQNSARLAAKRILAAENTEFAEAPGSRFKERCYTQVISKTCIKRIVLNLKSFLENELRIAENMRKAEEVPGANDFESIARWGVPLEQFIAGANKALADLLEKWLIKYTREDLMQFNKRRRARGMAEYAIRVETLHKFVTDPESSYLTIPGMSIYINTGLVGTARSIALFPERYKDLIGEDVLDIRMLEGRPGLLEFVNADLEQMLVETTGKFFNNHPLRRSNYRTFMFGD